LRPSNERFAENQRIFPDDVGQAVVNFLRINFLTQGRYIDCPRLQSLILILLHDFVVWDIFPESVLNFECSYHFMSHFLDRANVSFRKTPSTKRPTINDEACGHFLAELSALQAEYPAERILDFGKSSGGQ
jgi:hypothetical protein